MTSTISAQPTVLGRGKLALSTEWLNAAVVRINVQGEIDASTRLSSATTFSPARRTARP